MNRKEQIKKAAKDCIINPLFQSTIDRIIVESFTNGVKWADKNPIDNPWHDLRENDMDLPPVECKWARYNSSVTVELCFLNKEGEKRYGFGECHTNVSENKITHKIWRIKAYEDINNRFFTEEDKMIKIIAWKKLEKFEE